MNAVTLTEGEGRSKVSFKAEHFGGDIIVCIFNGNPHIGAVAVGEFDFTHQRASVSILTRLGHKDDALAQSAAHDISKSTQQPVCVIAGVHLDEVTLDEIKLIQENTRRLIARFLAGWKT